MELVAERTIDATGDRRGHDNTRSEAGPETIMVNIGHEITWSIVQLGLTSGTIPALKLKLKEGPDDLNQPVGSGP